MVSVEKLLGLSSEIPIEIESETELVVKGVRSNSRHGDQSPPIQEMKNRRQPYLKKNGGRTASESPYLRVKKHNFGGEDSDEEIKEDLSINGLGVSSTDVSSVQSKKKKALPYSNSRSKKKLSGIG